MLYKSFFSSRKKQTTLNDVNNAMKKERKSVITCRKDSILKRNRTKIFVRLLAKSSIEVT
jgi:hypothetical protein